MTQYKIGRDVTTQKAGMKPFKTTEWVLRFCTKFPEEFGMNGVQTASVRLTVSPLSAKKFMKDEALEAIKHLQAKGDKGWRIYRA